MTETLKIRTTLRQQEEAESGEERVNQEIARILFMKKFIYLNGIRRNTTVTVQESIVIIAALLKRRTQ